MLPCDCSVIDHGRRQNVVRTKMEEEQNREEGEMAQTMLGGGRNREKK